MTAVALVLQLILGDQQTWLPWKAGLTIEQCNTLLYGLPLPTNFGPAAVSWTCVREDHE